MNFKILGFIFKWLIEAKLRKPRAGMSQSRNKLVLNLLYLVSVDFTRESSCCRKQREIQILKKSNWWNKPSHIPVHSVLVCEDPSWNGALDAVVQSKFQIGSV